MRILFVGDIVGRPGRDAVKGLARRLREEWRLDFVVANAENAASGAGLTGRLARDLLAAGVDGITLGDHAWDQRGFTEEIGALERVCRPANLPAAQPGRRALVLAAGGRRLLVFTVLGRTFMPGRPADCPFRCADEILQAFAGAVDGVLVEVHAEATAEKIALGWYLDGRVGLIVGTHTHVPTRDAEILPRGSAYVTDAGMTGPHRSVLGREIDPVVDRMLDGLPRRFPVARGDVRLSGVLVELGPDGRAVAVESVQWRVPEAEGAEAPAGAEAGEGRDAGEGAD